MTSSDYIALFGFGFRTDLILSNCGRFYEISDTYIAQCYIIYLFQIPQSIMTGQQFTPEQRHIMTLKADYHVTGSSSHSLRMFSATKEHNQKNLVERGEKGCVRTPKTIPAVKDILDNNAYKASDDDSINTWIVSLMHN